MGASSLSGVPMGGGPLSGMGPIIAPSAQADRPLSAPNRQPSNQPLSMPSYRGTASDGARGRFEALADFGFTPMPSKLSLDFARETYSKMSQI